MRNLYLIVGASGSGKSTLADALGDYYNAEVMQSCTDRQRRYDGETGHVYLTPEQFTELESNEPMVAYTVFDGHRYGVTSSMLEQSDFYVIDPFGVVYLYKHYKGNRPIKVLGLYTSPEVLKKRLISRDGDTKRYDHDVEIFTESVMKLLCDKIIDTSGTINQMIEDTKLAVDEMERGNE